MDNKQMELTMADKVLYDGLMDTINHIERLVKDNKDMTQFDIDLILINTNGLKGLVNLAFKY